MNFPGKSLVFGTFAESSVNFDLAAMQDGNKRTAIGVSQTGPHPQYGWDFPESGVAPANQTKERAKTKSS